jgi:predicted nucleic acid-binding protein
LKTVFADSFYFFAYLSDFDEYHEKARSILSERPLRLITTPWVLIEVGDGLCSAPRRTLFVDFLRRLRSNPSVTILPSDDETIEEGFKLYAERPDKDWSLTDCISFVVMKRMGIIEAPTGDRHFEQAGFRALLLATESTE